MSKPSLSIFTGSEDLGTIFEEGSQINTKFVEVNTILSNTSGRVSFNFGGKTRILTLQGKHDGTGFTGATQEAKLGDFISSIETDWVNKGVQSSVSVTLTNSFGVSYLVDCIDFSWKRSNSQPNVILWSLLMKEKFI